MYSYFWGQPPVERATIISASHTATHCNTLQHATITSAVPLASGPVNLVLSGPALIYVCTFVCMYVRIYACVYVRVYVCMYVRIQVCMYVCL